MYPQELVGRGEDDKSSCEKSWEEGNKTSGEGKSSGEGDETFLEQLFLLFFHSAGKRYVLISFAGLRHTGQVLAPFENQFSKHFVPYS